MNKYYPGETDNIHIQSLINIMQENNRELPPKKGNGKLTLFRGNGEQVIPIYGNRGGTLCRTQDAGCGSGVCGRTVAPLLF